MYVPWYVTVGKRKLAPRRRNSHADQPSYPAPRTTTRIAKSIAFAKTRLTIPARSPWKLRASAGTVRIAGGSVSLTGCVQVVRIGGFLRRGTAHHPVNEARDRTVGAEGLHPDDPNALARDGPGRGTDDLGEVDPFDHLEGELGEIQARDHPLDVQPVGDRVDIELFDDLVQIDRGDDPFDVDVIEHDLGQIELIEDQVGRATGRFDGDRVRRSLDFGALLAPTLVPSAHEVRGGAARSIGDGADQERGGWTSRPSPEFGDGRGGADRLDCEAERGADDEGGGIGRSRVLVLLGCPRGHPDDLDGSLGAHTDQPDGRTRGEGEPVGRRWGRLPRCGLLLATRDRDPDDFAHVLHDDGLGSSGLPGDAPTSHGSFQPSSSVRGNDRSARGIGSLPLGRRRWLARTASATSAIFRLVRRAWARSRWKACCSSSE